MHPTTISSKDDSLKIKIWNFKDLRADIKSGKIFRGLSGLRLSRKRQPQTTEARNKRPAKPYPACEQNPHAEYEADNTGYNENSFHGFGSRVSLCQIHIAKKGLGRWEVKRRCLKRFNISPEFNVRLKVRCRS